MYSYIEPKGKIKIELRLADTSSSGGKLEGFKFNVYKGSGDSKTLLFSKVTGADGTIPEFEVEKGEYTIEEELTEEQKEYYQDWTGSNTGSVAMGEKMTFRFTNYYEW